MECGGLPPLWMFGFVVCGGLPPLWMFGFVVCGGLPPLWIVRIAGPGCGAESLTQPNIQSGGEPPHSIDPKGKSMTSDQRHRLIERIEQLSPERLAALERQLAEWERTDAHHRDWPHAPTHRLSEH